MHSLSDQRFDSRNDEKKGQVHENSLSLLVSVRVDYVSFLVSQVLKWRYSERSCSMPWPINPPYAASYASPLT